MPAQTRASMISLIASENRSKLRDCGVGTPKLLDVENAILSVPKKSSSVSTTAPLMHVCPDGCSGNGGVVNSGIQVWSARVAGFRSSSAWRIAVIGRQEFQ